MTAEAEARVCRSLGGSYDDCELGKALLNTGLSIIQHLESRIAHPDAQAFAKNPADISQFLLVSTMYFQSGAPADDI